ncbi:MAG: DUF58 domain-containing protein [Acidobacteriota bacterium]
MPSTRLLAALGLVTLLLPAGLLLPWMVPMAFAVDALLLLAFAVDLRRAAGASLEARREWPPLLVQDSPAVVETAVTSRASRALRLRLREGLSPALAPAPRRHEMELPAGGRGEWSVELSPSRRGDHAVAPLTVRCLGPWGLAWSQRDLLPVERRAVFPQVRWQGKVGQLLVLAQRRQLGTPDRHLRGVGSEPYGLREYLPGDPLNRIHWKATARHGRLVTREETWERGARLVVLIDGARAMASLDGARSKLDHALAAALALTRVAAARGDQVTVVGFSDRVERTVRVGRSMAAAYRALYDFEARLVEPAYDLAVEAAIDASPRRATVLLFTSVVDLVAGEVLRDALLKLERRHRPMLINLQDAELSHLALDPPVDADAAYAQASALEILLANRRLTQRMRRAGVRVVQPVADRLALETLESYLEIFRGRGSR